MTTCYLLQWEAFLLHCTIIGNATPYCSGLFSFLRLTPQNTTLLSQRNFIRFLIEWLQLVAFQDLMLKLVFSTITDLILRLGSMLTNQSLIIHDLCCLTGEKYHYYNFSSVYWLSRTSDMFFLLLLFYDCGSQSSFNWHACICNVVFKVQEAL